MPAGMGKGNPRVQLYENLYLPSGYGFLVGIRVWAKIPEGYPCKPLSMDNGSKKCG
jgi:hypothetical protein